MPKCKQQHIDRHPKTLRKGYGRWRTTDNRVHPVTITPIVEDNSVTIAIECQQSVKGYQEYIDYLNSKQWKKIRQRVLNRDKYRCRDCGAGKHLEVHHLTYKRIFKEWLTDLITLCADCHRKKHQ